MKNKKHNQKIILDPRGQWAHPGQPTRIPGNDITMDNVPYPVMAYPNFGSPVMMYPEQEYDFPGAEYVDEYPQMQDGGTVPVIEDAGSFNEEGFWIPDWETMKQQAKELNAKTVKTKNGAMIYFDDNWNVQSVDDNPQMKLGGSKSKHVVVKQSKIKGANKGLFSNQKFKKHQLIGLAHRNGQPVGDIGKMHNHSEKPNMYSVKRGNERYVYAKRDIEPGEELTTNYRFQPELEQPEDFQTGGAISWTDAYNKNVPSSQKKKVENYQKTLKRVEKTTVKKPIDIKEEMKAQGLDGAYGSELGVQKGNLEAAAEAALGDSNLNPYNTSSDRGVMGYISDVIADAPQINAGSIDEAFLTAKEQGLSEFKWNGQRYNTQLKMSLADESKVKSYRPAGAKDMSYQPVVINYYGVGNKVVPGGPGHIEAFSLNDPDYQINANDANWSAFGESGNFLNADIGQAKSADPTESIMVYLTPEEYKNFQKEVGSKKGTKYSELSGKERGNNPDYYNVLTQNCSDATCRAMGVADPGNIIAKTAEPTTGFGGFGTLPNAAFEAIRKQYSNRWVPATGRALDLGTYVPEKQSTYHKSPLPGREILRGMGFKEGGSPKVRMPNPKKGLKSKAYSRSLEATNRLFTLNPLFDKPKSRKRKVFDPNASFYQDGGTISFDFDDTLDTDMGLQMAKSTPSSSMYIISARPEVTPDMVARAKLAGIPEDRIFAMGSDEAKIAKIRELDIDRHIDNKQSVVDKLGYTGQLFQEGGQNRTDLSEEDELAFQSFYNSLPENLQSDDDTYDIRGYWDGLGRPAEFDYSQPTEDDGYYHAFSINPNTGEYLKSPAHETFQHAVDEDRKIGYRPVTNVYGRNIAVENESIVDPEQLSFLANQEGPVNYIETELTPEEIEQYARGGFIVEEIDRFQDGGATTVPTEQEAQTNMVSPVIIPEMIPTAEFVTPPTIQPAQVIQPSVQQPTQQPASVVSQPASAQTIPTKKEVEKVAMPKIEQSGDVWAIQKKLKAAGYDIGTSGKNRDGVDGVMGNRTKMALDAFNAGIPPSKAKTVTPKKSTTTKSQVVNKNLGTGYLPYLDKGEEVCVKGKGCSYNVSVKMGNLLGGIADGDIWANDAWFNKSDMVNKGGDLIYQTTERDFSKMPKVPKELYSKLQVGDYVQLNRPDTKTSGEFAAERKGNLQNENVEHLGFIVGKDKDGTPLVWHGSEKGKAFIQRIDQPITLDDHDKSIFTYQVASIVRSPNLKNVDMSGLQNTAYYSTIDPKQKLVPGKKATDLQKQAANVINNNAKNFKNLGYSQEDANFVGQILVGGIMMNETSGGESYKRIPKQVAATVWKEWLGQGNFEGDEASIGYYQMKPNLNFTNKDGSLNTLGQRLEKLGVDPKDISTFDINAQTKAGTIILLDNYEKLKKDPDFNIKTGLYKGKIPASYILAKSWQAGVDWQNKDKYKKFLNNLDIDYSDKALLNAIGSISIAGSKKTVNADYAKVKAYQDKINAKKIAAEKKKAEERRLAKEKMYKGIMEGKAMARNPLVAESTAIRNLPTKYPDLRKLDLTKKKPVAKAKPKQKGAFEEVMDYWKSFSKPTPTKKAVAKKAVPKKVVAKKAVAKPPVKKPVIQPVSVTETLKRLHNPSFYNKFEKGGIVAELSQKEIDAYKKAGYIIEELD